MLTQEQIKQTVTDYFKDKPVSKVYLFGSYARGEAVENSDIDLLLEISDEVDITYFTLGNYLADLKACLQSEVDLTTSGALRKDRLITKFIEEQKKLLYAKAD